MVWQYYRVITIVGFQPSYNQLPFKAGEKYIPSDGVRVQLRVLEGSREFCPRGLINGFATKPRCRTLSLVFRNFKRQFTSHSVSLRMGFLNSASGSTYSFFDTKFITPGIFPRFLKQTQGFGNIHPRKLTWLAGTSTMNEDGFPIEHRDFFKFHVRF